MYWRAKALAQTFKKMSKNKQIMTNTKKKPTMTKCCGGGKIKKK